MYKSTILPLAKEDIRDAALWYNKQQNGLGRRFTSEIQSKVLFMKQNPKASNVRYDDVRTAILNVFPYMIHFTLDEGNKSIVILAVLHTSRNPRLWESRSK